jgi:hypothetical protein
MRGRVPPTQGWQDFRTLLIGDMTIEQPGRMKVMLKPDGPLRHALMNLRSVRLRPTNH